MIQNSPCVIPKLEYSTKSALGAFLLLVVEQAQAIGGWSALPKKAGDCRIKVKFFQEKRATYFFLFWGGKSVTGFGRKEHF